MTSESSPEPLCRRPIRARNTRWAHAAAGAMVRVGLRPNAISVGSVGFAVLGAVALVGAGRVEGIAARVALLLGAGLCVQGRLLCNLMDGLVAVEGGFRTKAGEIFNELPDRVSDALFLTAAGYATPAALAQGWEPAWGWAATTLAVIVAYVRALGGQAGATQQFCGPMAKQQRMFTLTLACVLAAGETIMGRVPHAMGWALALVALGSAWTAWRRAVRIVRELEARP